MSAQKRITAHKVPEIIHLLLLLHIRHKSQDLLPVFADSGVVLHTGAGVYLIYSCSGIAVSFFVIKNYYDNIPRELEEAARIDGCGYVQTWVKVIFPIARPGIMTAAVLAFLNNWNEYYWASLVLITREKLTVPALLSTFTTAFNTNYNGLFSAMVVIILPPVILYCVFSKFFIEALSGGAVKG